MTVRTVTVKRSLLRDARTVIEAQERLLACYRAGSLRAPATAIDTLHDKKEPTLNALVAALESSDAG